MTHFPILVIGEDINAQLAPYDENLLVAPYPDPDWDHDEWLARATKYYTEFFPDKAPEDKSPQGLLAKYMEGDGDLRFDEDGHSTLYLTYNPKSKWDWWTIGGRWPEMLILKDGARANQAKKSQIDFQAMRDENLRKDQALWQKMLTATAGTTPPEESFGQLSDRLGDRDQAMRIWEANDWVQATRKITVFSAYETFHMHAENPEQSYFDEANAWPAPRVRAAVKDSQWHQYARAGWFGVFTDEMPVPEWDATVKRLIDEADDNETFTIIDCHI